MERLYNPDLMSEAEIKQTFVARQSVVDDLLGLVRNQGQGAGVQHAVIVAPRGMGKTTILLMVQFGLTDTGLAEEWQAIRFPEESYAVNDLADFWLETLRNLAVAVEEPELAEKADALLDRFPETKDLQEAAYAVLVQWSKTHKKRLLLLVDNFDQILEQISSELDNAALRNVLMNDGTVMLIGGATTIFHEARAYDQPLYNFFKIFNLPELSFGGVQDLLRRRADADGEENFEATLQANKARLRVLRYFMGGNPRLVLMLYRVLSQSEVTEVRESLEKLLDEVTPYYKAKIDSLPPQQRKILDHIARISNQTSEGVTPGEVAKAARVTPQAASKQLQRLGELGYVRAANVRGRNSYYTLSEPLYAIWHQMRFGLGVKRRIQWLVNFLKGWYGDEGLGNESQRLATLFSGLLEHGLNKEARKALEYRRLIAHAIAKDEAFEEVICDYLKIEEFEALKKEVLPEIKLEKLSQKVLENLRAADCISVEQFQIALNMNKRESAVKLINMGLVTVPEKDYWKQGLEYFNEAMEMSKDSEIHMIAALYIGKIKLSLEDYKGALEASELAFKARKNITGNVSLLDDSETKEIIEEELYNMSGTCLLRLHRFEESIKKFEYSLNVNPNQEKIWRSTAIAYLNLKQYTAATKNINQAISIAPDDKYNWMYKGISLNLSGKKVEGLDCIKKFLPSLLLGDPSNERKDVDLNLAFLLTLVNQDLTGAKYVFDLIRTYESNSATWQDLRSQLLLHTAQKGDAEFVLGLINETKTEDTFLPLHRALSYLSTGDELLIEKLSPEVRNLVLEMVEEFRPQFADEPKPLPKKPKTAPRKRINKQLN